MKNSKRILALILVLIVSLSVMLTGCGQKEPQKETSTSSAPTQSAGVQTDDSPEAKLCTDIAEWAKGHEKPYTIGFLNNYIGNNWRVQWLQNVEDAEAYYQSTGEIKEIIVQSANADVTAQLNQFNDMINQGVDCILLNPTSTTALQTSIDRAREEGILVVIIEAPAPYEGVLNIGYDHEFYAKTYTEWLCEKLGGKGNIVEIYGVEGNPASTCRTDVWAEVLKNYPDIKLLGGAPGAWSSADAQTAMSQLLSTYDNIDGLLAEDAMGIGILRAFENAGIKDYPYMTGDNTVGFLRTWQKERFDSIAICMHQGIIWEGVGFCVELLNGGQLDPQYIKGNIFDENVKNYVVMETPYIITTEADPDAEYMKNQRFTKAIGIDEAVELTANLSDESSLDGWLAREQIKQFFK